MARNEAIPELCQSTDHDFLQNEYFANYGKRRLRLYHDQ
jgi:hypothetical protein